MSASLERRLVRTGVGHCATSAPALLVLHVRSAAVVMAMINPLTARFALPRRTTELTIRLWSLPMVVPSAARAAPGTMRAPPGSRQSRQLDRHHTALLRQRGVGFVAAEIELAMIGGWPAVRTIFHHRGDNESCMGDAPDAATQQGPRSAYPRGPNQ
jgi:hypothetical protein